MPSGGVLTEIYIDDSQVVKLLGPIISASIKTRYVRMLNKLGDLSVKAYQSKVPIDTGELRNQIMILKRASSKDPSVHIGIINSLHIGRRGHAMPAPILGDILNIGKGPRGEILRSQTSRSIEPFSSIGRRQPTRGWIRSARSAFATAKRKYLSSLS